MKNGLFLLDMLPFLALIAIVSIFGKLLFGETEYDDFAGQEDDFDMR